MAGIVSCGACHFLLRRNKSAKQTANRYADLHDKLPATHTYAKFIEWHNGWESDLGDELGYAVIWNRESIQERWDDYEMAKYLIVLSCFRDCHCSFPPRTLFVSM